jgi:histone-lysine N-methyltransferase SETMAR
MGVSLPNPNQSLFECNGKIRVHFPQIKATPSAGKVMFAVFWDSQGVLLAYFQKRGENVNSASYCEVLLKLRDKLLSKRPGQLARVVLLHHDNARPHTARATQERIQELQWEHLEHPP